MAASYPARSGRLEWSCAGHPRPLLLRGRKIVAELSCDPVLPFGLGDGAPKPRVAELEPDDAVLLHTDGVTEARTADGELFGLDRLVDLLSGKPPAAGRPRNCCAAWCGPCSSIKAAACATTPPCCWCSGPAPDRAAPAALISIRRSSTPDTRTPFSALLTTRHRRVAYEAGSRPAGLYTTSRG
jgi:hypothetical protein